MTKPVHHLTPTPTEALTRRGAVATLLAAGFQAAQADETYPARPVTLVVGYPPGGVSDAVARPVAEALAKALGQRVVVDNVGGAAGALGAQKVASATADGYTLLLGANAELVSTQLLNPRQRYDGLRDFTPIGLVARQAALLVASRATGVRTLDQFVERVRQAPGRYSYGTSGVGSFLHYCGEILRDRLGLQITHVPYKGVAPLGNDLAGGTIEFGFMGTGPATRSLIEAGTIVPLAVTSATRLPTFAQVQAIAERADTKGYDLSGWFALMSPGSTPASVVIRLQAALKQALADPALRKALLDLGGLLAGQSQGDDNLPRLMRDDHERYRRFITVANIEVQK